MYDIRSSIQKRQRLIRLRLDGREKVWNKVRQGVEEVLKWEADTVIGVVRSVVVTEWKGSLEC